VRYAAEYKRWSGNRKDKRPRFYVFGGGISDTGPQLAMETFVPRRAERFVTKPVRVLVIRAETLIVLRLVRLRFFVFVRNARVSRKINNVRASSPHHRRSTDSANTATINGVYRRRNARRPGSVSNLERIFDPAFRNVRALPILLLFTFTSSGVAENRRQTQRVRTDNRRPSGNRGSCTFIATGGPIVYRYTRGPRRSADSLGRFN